jgi:hypothetical protein
MSSLTATTCTVLYFVIGKLNGQPIGSERKIVQILNSCMRGRTLMIMQVSLDSNLNANSITAMGFRQEFYSEEGSRQAVAISQEQRFVKIRSDIKQRVSVY